MSRRRSIKNKYKTSKPSKTSKTSKRNCSVEHTNKENKRVVVIGGSGHGSSVIDALLTAGDYDVVGVLDDGKPLDYEVFGSIKVIGRIDDLPKLCESLGVVGAVVAIGVNTTRSLLVEKVTNLLFKNDYIIVDEKELWRSRGGGGGGRHFAFVRAIHPSAIMSRTATIGPGTVLLAGAIVGANTKIGAHCIVNTRAAADHDCVLLDYSTLCPGALLAGNVQIGEYSSVSMGASVAQKVHIGNDTVIGAGSVVLKDVGDNALAFGVPAKFVRSRARTDKQF
eukprot:TRINITY_DN872_c0_g1_i2.p1 TRINITY_DN872_c0_g1~~TRINITY_DN872_c0_g1_i2.p1  ORF type:complete len:280 (+),score=49.50 TRINITY_DN872_c0_g1_i2:858-1697(+)